MTPVLISSLRLVFVIGVFSLSACSPIQPWIKPYERQNIADPLMSFDRDPVAGGYLHHVYDAREAARGGDGGAGGGCGCN